MFPVFHPNGRKKKINGKWLYQIEVIGNHGVCATWVDKDVKKSMLECNKRSSLGLA